MAPLVKPIQTMWTCPKCNRQFARKGQPHSCKSFAVDQHFKGRPAEKKLYEHLKSAIKKQVRNTKIESLECCIHFVSTYTFAAVKVMRGKLRIEFALSYRVNSKRMIKKVKNSAHRWLHVLDITNSSEINDDLLNWIQQAWVEKSSELVV